MKPDPGVSGGRSLFLKSDRGSLGSQSSFQIINGREFLTQEWGPGCPEGDFGLLVGGGAQLAQDRVWLAVGRLSPQAAGL